MTVALAPTGKLSGALEAEAARRLAERGPPQRPRSRSYASIVRANVFTVFNLILAVAGAVTLAFGEWQDALFLGVLVANAGDRDRAGGAREARARPAGGARRAARDRRARRRGAAVRSRRSSVGDLVRLGPGDQVVADGTLERAESLRLDESILTGESRAGRARGRRRGALGLVRGRGIGAYAVTAVGDRQLRGAGSPARRARSAIRARRSSARSTGSSSCSSR